MIPTSIDGTDITGATIDGTDVQEITVDGDVVFSAGPIPDIQDLEAHYDFSQENGTVPVTDLSGNGVDLASGSYSGVGVNINGVQAGDFSGSSDVVYNHDGDLVIPEPSTVFMIFEVNSSSVADRFFDADSANDFSFYHSGANVYTMGFDNNTNKVFASGNTPSAGDITLLMGVKTSSQGILRYNQTQFTGSGSNSDQTGVTIGARGDLGFNSDIKVGEVLIYDGDKSGIAADVESYLIDKWGPLN